MRDAADAGIAGNILGEGKQVQGGDAVAIEVHAKDIREFAERSNVTNRNVEAASGGFATESGERIAEKVAGVVKVKAEGQIVLRAAIASAPRSDSGQAQRMHEPDIHVVAVVGERFDEMKILRVSGQVGRGNEAQE